MRAISPGYIGCCAVNISPANMSCRAVSILSRRLGLAIWAAECREEQIWSRWHPKTTQRLPIETSYRQTRPASLLSLASPFYDAAHTAYADMIHQCGAAELPARRLLAPDTDAASVSLQIIAAIVLPDDMESSHQTDEQTGVV